MTSKSELAARKDLVCLRLSCRSLSMFWIKIFCLYIFDSFKLVSYWDIDQYILSWFITKLIQFVFHTEMYTCVVYFYFIKVQKPFYLFCFYVSCLFIFFMHRQIEVNISSLFYHHLSCKFIQALSSIIQRYPTQIIVYILLS